MGKVSVAGNGYDQVGEGGRNGHVWSGRVGLGNSPASERIFVVNASLVFVLPDGSQKELPLKKSRLVVGRQEGVQIRLNTSSISRQHCEFMVNDTGISVKDLGSSNGTFVNKRRITQTVLSAGDIVGIGNQVLVVRIDGAPAKIDSPDILRRGLVSPASPSPSSLGSAGVAVAKPRGAAAAKRPVGDDDGPGGAADVPGGAPDKDSSSEWDFDFLDGKDKDLPKL